MEGARKPEALARARLSVQTERWYLMGLLENSLNQAPGLRNHWTTREANLGSLKTYPDDELSSRDADCIDVGLGTGRD